MVSPDYIDIPATYNGETAKKYDAATHMEVEKAKKESQKSEQDLLWDIYYKNLYLDKKFTTSKTNISQLITYPWTDFTDKTDTYINMNSSYRFIKYNIGGASEKYNQLIKVLGKEWSAKKDSAKIMFANIAERLQALGYDKIYKEGKREKNPFSDDRDFMYSLWLFQIAMQRKWLSTSGADFRIWPKTLSALIDGSVVSPTKTEEVVPVTKVDVPVVVPVNVTPVVPIDTPIVVSTFPPKELLQIPTKIEVAPLLPIQNMKEILPTLENKITTIVQKIEDKDNANFHIWPVDVIHFYNDVLLKKEVQELEKKEYKEKVEKEVQEKLDLYFPIEQITIQESRRIIEQSYSPAQILIMIRLWERRYPNKPDAIQTYIMQLLTLQPFVV